MKIIKLFLFGAMLITLVSIEMFAQTFVWRYRGGNHDGYALAAPAACDLNGIALANRYRGGNHDGHDADGMSSDFAGNDFQCHFAGGIHDGYARGECEAADLQGRSFASRYLGSNHDGYAMRSATADLAGNDVLSRYTGSNHDGYAMRSTTADLAGNDVLARYTGGNHDGYAMRSTTADLSGNDFLARYTGGNHDGYAMQSTTVDLAGNDLLARYTGGNHDGYALEVCDAVDLGGQSIAVRYYGGIHDGYNVATYSPPTGNVPRFIVKAFLQGPFSNGEMITNLNTAGFLPLSQPYNESPWWYMEDESVTAIPSSSIVDWVLCEIRTGTAANTLVERKAGFVKTTGEVVALDGSSPIEFQHSAAGDYYFVLRHRNHLAIMSADAAHTSAMSTAMIDFRQSQSSAYGTEPMAQLGANIFGLWAGDVTSNGMIKFTGAHNDRVKIFTRVGSLLGTVNGYYKEDVNMNAQVKYFGIYNDRAIIFDNVGSLIGYRLTQVP